MTTETLKATPKQLGGATGKGFMPGQSGNPAGRPKGLASLVRERTKDGKILLDFMVDVLQGKPQKVDLVIPGPDGEKRVTVEKTPEVRDRIEAVKWLGDRGWGKPLQQVDMGASKPFIVEHRLWGPGRDPLAVPAEGTVEAEAASVVSVVPVKALEGRK